jgi:hypothetical protein
MIIARIVVLEFTSGSGDLGTPFIKYAWKDNVTA